MLGEQAHSLSRVQLHGSVTLGGFTMINWSVGVHDAIF